MAMLRPSYKITLGATTVSSEALGPLRSLEVRRDKRGAADEAVIDFGTGIAVEFSQGDPASIELGWDGTTSTVFTGTVGRVEQGITRLVAHCFGAQMKLMTTRADQAFVSRNAGQIVTELAGKAGTSTDTIEDGIDLAVYFVDSARSMFAHCIGLAVLSGFDLYTTAEGKLVFASLSTTSADHSFHYGSEILAAAVERAAPLDGATAIPESPASSAGDDKASWLVKDSSAHEGTAGSGAATVPFSDPVLRTRDAAESAAKARLYFSRRAAISGTVELMGTPDANLGETAELTGVPAPGVDGLYQIMAVTHRLDAGRGFRTLLHLGGMP
jgi:phage protein D